MALVRTLYTRNALAVEFGRDRRTVTKKLEGVEPDREIDGVPHWYLTTVLEPLTGNDVADPSKQRAELDAARTRKIELDIAVAEGRLLGADEVRMALAAMNSNVAARLRGVPSAKASIANPTDPARAEAAISSGIEEALAELSDDLFGSGEALSADSEDDDLGVGGRSPGSESGVEFGAGSLEN